MTELHTTNLKYPPPQSWGRRCQVCLIKYTGCLSSSRYQSGREAGIVALKDVSGRPFPNKKKWYNSICFSVTMKDWVVQTVNCTQIVTRHRRKRNWNIELSESSNHRISYSRGDASFGQCPQLLFGLQKRFGPCKIQAPDKDLASSGSKA